MPVRDLRYGVDIRNVAVRIAERLDKDRLRIVPDRTLDLAEVMDIDKRRVHAELVERVRQKIEAAAVDRLLRNNVVACLRERLQRVGDRSCAGRHCQRRDAAFQRGDALLKHTLCGVGQTAVDIAGVGKSEPRRGMITVAEYIGSRLIDRDGSCIGCGIGLLLPDVKLQGFKFVG